MSVLTILSSLDYQAIPLTTAPSQTISITLGGQPCRINVYTKSTNIPSIGNGNAISVTPPVYENVNPVYVDLYVNDVLIIGGVVALHGNAIVRDAYLGFIGDIAIYDMMPSPGSDGDDPFGVPLRLPPPDLRNWWQRVAPQWLGGEYAPASVAGSIPGMGTRFELLYWPNAL